MKTELRLYFRKRLIVLIQFLLISNSFASSDVILNASQFKSVKCEKVFTKEIVFTDEVLLVIQELAKLYNKIMFSQEDSEEIIQGKIIFKANMNELVQRLSPEEFKQAKRLIYNKDNELISRYTQENARKFEEQRRKKLENEAIENVVEAEINTLRLKEVLDKYASFYNIDSERDYFLSVRNEVEKILKKPISNINVKNKNNETILYLAAFFGDQKLIDLALKQQADANAKVNSWTALMQAACNGNKEIVQMLLDAKADVDAKNKNGEAALMWASNYGRKEIVQMLIDAKADVNAKSNDGYTALMWASGNNKKEIVHMLIVAKASVDAKDNNEQTALIRASKFGHKEVVQVLIEANANVKIVDKFGKTALKRASELGHKEIVQMLKAATASSNDTFGISTIRKATASVLTKATNMLKAAGAKK